jgi:hypothetical protein
MTQYNKDTTHTLTNTRTIQQGHHTHPNKHKNEHVDKKPYDHRPGNTRS